MWVKYDQTLANFTVANVWFVYQTRGAYYSEGFPINMIVSR